MCENDTNEIVFVMDYLNRYVQLHHCVISLSVDQKKYSLCYMYKITVLPFIKMLNSQSAFMASSWIKNKNVTKLSKIHDFLQDLGIIMHEV